MPLHQIATTSGFNQNTTQTVPIYADSGLQKHTTHYTIQQLHSRCFCSSCWADSAYVSLCIVQSQPHDPPIPPRVPAVPRTCAPGAPPAPGCQNFTDSAKKNGKVLIIMAIKRAVSTVGGSLTGIRTRAFGVRNRDPNQLDYEG